VIPLYQDRVAQRDRIEALRQEHQQCVSAPERLLGELYSALGGSILESLRGMPQARLEKIASLDPNLNSFLKKELGLKKQVQYLRELSVCRSSRKRKRSMAKSTSWK